MYGCSSRPSSVISIHIMFLLIDYPETLCSFHQAISIHIMFLLIDIRTWRKRPDTAYFNTSHVSINPAPCKSWKKLEYFNTSHVSINHLVDGKVGTLLMISIHLMFLLIKRTKSVVILFCGFQYISCFY